MRREQYRLDVQDAIVTVTARERGFWEWEVRYPSGHKRNFDWHPRLAGAKGAARDEYYLMHFDQRTTPERTRARWIREYVDG